MLSRPPAPRQPSATATPAAEPPVADIGVGIDTSRYGHHAAFLDAQLQTAAADLEMSESAAGYAQLIHRGDGRGRTFSVDLESNVYQCFAATCASQGDVIDLWASVNGMSLRVAALDLVSTFDLEPSPPTPGTEKRNG